MSQPAGRVRLSIALLLQIGATLFSLIGWIDALEGGAAVFVAGLLFLAAWLVGRVKPPLLTWISILVALVIDVAFYIAYSFLFGWGEGATPPADPAGAQVIVMTISDIFSFSSYFVAAGAVWYVIRVGGALRQAFRA